MDKNVWHTRSSYCTHKEGGMGNTSNGSKLLWENIEYRQKVLERSFSKFWHNPEHKEKLREIQKTEKYREKLSAATKISANRPDKILRTSETSKERWKDESYRKNMSIKTGNFMKGTRYIHNTALEQNKKVSSDELDTFLNNGWVLGLNLKFSKKLKKQHEEP